MTKPLEGLFLGFFPIITWALTCIPKTEALCNEGVCEEAHSDPPNRPVIEKSKLSRRDPRGCDTYVPEIKRNIRLSPPSPDDEEGPNHRRQGVFRVKISRR
jgi:hypothetical protein